MEKIEAKKRNQAFLPLDPRANPCLISPPNPFPPACLRKTTSADRRAAKAERTRDVKEIQKRDGEHPIYNAEEPPILKVFGKAYGWKVSQQSRVVESKAGGFQRSCLVGVSQTAFESSRRGV